MQNEWRFHKTRTERPSESIKQKAPDMMYKRIRAINNGPVQYRQTILREILEFI